MAFALIAIVIAAIVAVVWFFVARSPERASSHVSPSGQQEDRPERSHFAPGDAGSEEQRA